MAEDAEQELIAAYVILKRKVACAPPKSDITKQAILSKRR
jgi:hypothetical protein